MSKLLGNLEEGLAFVLSAPAGTGKTTLVDRLEKEYACVVKSISYTTRQPREGEVQGKDYFFVTEKEFEQRIEENDFLEYVKLYGHYYGTSRSWVEQRQKEGKHVFLVIDTQGGLQLKAKFPAIFIFVKPPSMQELRDRLVRRRTESSEKVEERLAWAEREMADAEAYDYVIVNDNLEIAFKVLKSIVIAEEHRI